MKIASKFLCIVLVGFFFAFSAIGNAGETLCKLSLVRVFKNRPEPDQPGGKVVIARPDGTVIRSYDNSEVREEKSQQGIPDSANENTWIRVPFHGNYEIVFRLGHIANGGGSAAVTVISARLERKMSNGKQTIIALGTTSANQLTLRSPEIPNAALANGLADVTGDYEHTVKQGWAPDGTPAMANVYCTRN